jgi:hypothetical protein
MRIPMIYFFLQSPLYIPAISNARFGNSAMHNLAFSGVYKYKNSSDSAVETTEKRNYIPATSKARSGNSAKFR